MTNHVINNYAENFGKVVLWQYDHAINLLRTLNHIQSLFVASVSRFWDYWVHGVLGFNTCDEIGLTIWGDIIGVSRPKITDGTTTRFINKDTYRKLLKAAYFIMKSDATLPNIAKYANILFGIDGKYSEWKVVIPESPKTVGWTKDIHELKEGGKTVGWRIDIKNASGFVINYLEADADDLKTETHIYLYGETAEGAMTFDDILVSASRHNEMGVTLEDGQHMNLTYKPNEKILEPEHAKAFDCMDDDQKAIYNQLSEDYLVYPLGIRYNHIYEADLFGFSGQENDAIMFDENETYDKNDIVGHIDTDPQSGNPERLFYRCLKDNVKGSWNDVKNNFEKTSADGGFPYVGSFNGDNPTADYEAHRAYEVGVMVWHAEDGKKKPYICITAMTADVNTGWSVVASRFKTMYYRTHVSYATNEYIINEDDGMTYVCTSPLDLNANVNWSSARAYFTLCWNATIFEK